MRLLKDTPDGTKFDIAVYVDDLLLGCKSTKALEEFVQQLTTKYKEVTVNRGTVQEYLGMAVDFS